MKAEEKEKLGALLQHAICRLDSLWCHHQDGSDLLVDKSRLFAIVQNDVLGSLRKANRIAHGQDGIKFNYNTHCYTCGLKKDCCSCREENDKIEAEKAEEAKKKG